MSPGVERESLAPIRAETSVTARGLFVLSRHVRPTTRPEKPTPTECRPKECRTLGHDPPAVRLAERFSDIGCDRQIAPFSAVSRRLTVFHRRHEPDIDYNRCGWSSAVWWASTSVAVALADVSMR